VPQLKPGQLNIIFDCGSEDFFAAVNAELHQALLDAKIPHDYISRPGVHNADYWRNSILYQLLYFNEIFTR
jgi:enterochelin esterase-like enzyme